MNGGRRLVSATMTLSSSRSCGTALVMLLALQAGRAHAQSAAAPVATPPAAPVEPAPAPVAAPPAPKPGSLAAADAAEAAEAAKDEILVTAHRQRGAVATDIPPETSLNAVAIHALGAADIEEVFADLAPEIQTGSSGSGRSAQTPVVLVNGQRIAGFSSIKDLPPEAIRRIEIFPEEVALQYGYPADQRVVNVVLRSKYRALTLLGRYTLAPDNFRGTYRAKADLIRIGENSNWNIDLDYRHQDPLFADTSFVAPTASASSAPPRPTVAQQDDRLTVSGSSTNKIGAVNATLTGSLDLETIQSRPGLQQEDGDQLLLEGLPDLVGGPFSRVDQTADFQTALTLNGKLDNNWRWSTIGKLEDSTRITTTDPATGNAGLDTVLLPSPGLLGDHCGPIGRGDCVSTEQKTASGDAYLNGDLFALPAGPVTAALRGGFVFSGIRSASPLDPQHTDRNRDEGNAQANLDFPITSRNSPVGKITVGANGEVRQLSDFGTLTTVGSTFDWQPSKPIDVLASFTREQQAPSLLELAEAGLTTPDLREFDFVSDSTTIVQRIDQGNADLTHETSQTAKLRLQVKPLRVTDLTLSGEFTIDRTDNPIASITAATAATEAAFPDRFTRENGYLTVFDVSPVNLARRDREQLRWGLNYSTAFGAPRPAALGSGSPPSRNQFQIALYDTWRLQDDVWLRDGLSKLDLLGHDTISDTGGTPTHQVELQTTVSTEAWSADINAVWQTPTTVSAGTLSQDRLTYSQGVTLNLRLQINLADQHWLNRIFPALRGSLNLSMDNLAGAHTRVHDADGGVPSAYAQNYLNPTGRTFRITLRKRFH